MEPLTGIQKNYNNNVELADLAKASLLNQDCFIST